MHFTPTNKQTQNLLNEGISSNSIVETGNTVVMLCYGRLVEVRKRGLFTTEIEELKIKFQLGKDNIGNWTSEGEFWMNAAPCRSTFEISERDDVTIIYQCI
jgi:UDP-N-acetylglucosamine 2-epimerase (non-hydrolysing)